VDEYQSYGNGRPPVTFATNSVDNLIGLEVPDLLEGQAAVASGQAPPGVPPPSASDNDAALAELTSMMKGVA